MRTDSILTAGLLGWAVWTGGAVALAQFQPPPNALNFEDTGTLEVVQPELIKFRDSKSDAWVLRIQPETKITVEGPAEVGCLRPGVTVEFTGQIDKKGNLTKPVDEITIITPQGRSSLGVFAADDTAGTKPLRGASAGSYRIKGKLASYRDGELVVIAGNRKITGKVDDELEVDLSVDDASIAQAGDEMKIKAWYDDTSRPNPNVGKPGLALAEEISITLAKPLAAGGKKVRQADKPARPASKSRAAK